MPNVFDYTVAAGYRKNDLTLTANFTQQQTRGGGDIRRQDSPFVSNRVNFSRAGATLTYPLPRLRDLGFWLIYCNTFDGRNVGQANTCTTGFLYTFYFERSEPHHNAEPPHTSPASPATFLLLLPSSSAAAKASPPPRPSPRSPPPPPTPTPAPGR